uniref:Putative extracellular protein TR9_089 n=1 Tax=Trebouxia lynnae TaxID=1825957 RepID=A0A7L9QFA3_9CHLO|nr:putative extracellular protein TR9_089 [Trebouxia lynnae]
MRSHKQCTPLLLAALLVFASSVQAATSTTPTTVTTPTVTTAPAAPATTTAPVAVATTAPVATLAPVAVATTAPTTPVTGATPAATPAATDSLGVSTVTPTAGSSESTALTVVLRIAGNDVWPFDNTKIAGLTQSLAAVMTSITPSDVNTLSAVQTASNTSRRLLASSSADVTAQLNAGSTAGVTVVATDLNKVVASGSLASKLSTNGVKASSVSVLSATADSQVDDTSSCTNGAINGICIGKSTRNGIGSGAIIAIAAVGGIVILVLATICFCCCRSRWRNRASAIEAATLAKAQPKPEPMTPTGPAPFAVNYPQFQGQKSGLPARTGSYIPPRTISEGKSGATAMTANAAAPPTVKE